MIVIIQSSHKYVLLKNWLIMLFHNSPFLIIIIMLNDPHTMLR